MQYVESYTWCTRRVVSRGVLGEHGGPVNI